VPSHAVAAIAIQREGDPIKHESIVGGQRSLDSRSDISRRTTRWKASQQARYIDHPVIHRTTMPAPLDALHEVLEEHLMATHPALKMLDPRPVAE